MMIIATTKPLHAILHLHPASPSSGASDQVATPGTIGRVRTRDGDPRRTVRAIFRLDRRDPRGKARDRSARGCSRQAQSAGAAARIVAEMLGSPHDLFK